MKTTSKYQQAKTRLKTLAKDIKLSHPTDKPMIRMVINDGVDAYTGYFSLSDYQRDLLSNYACKLHPKN